MRSRPSPDMGMTAVLTCVNSHMSPQLSIIRESNLAVRTVEPLRPLPPDFVSGRGTWGKEAHGRELVPRQTCELIDGIWVEEEA